MKISAGLGLLILCAVPAHAPRGSATSSLARLNAADRALMPHSDVAPWFGYSGTAYVPPDRDPWWDQSNVIEASMYGAIPDDGQDDTGAIQAAYDAACGYVKWDMTPRSPSDKHGFVMLDPGVYTVTQIHPCAGTTLYGYGATLQRPPWSWWLDRHGGDESAARAEAGSSAARIINGVGYHPRIEYRWRGTSNSPPMRFVGITLDGNVASGGFPDWHDYQFWNAHLAVFDSSGEGGVQEDVGNLRVELIDVTARESPSDCISVVSNVDLFVRRYQTWSCFRGSLNSLGANNYIDARYLYLTGPPRDMRSIDREPQGTSLGFDKVTGQDWHQGQRSAREYWHLRDIIIAAGLDLAASVIPESSATKEGGQLLIERLYVLRPHTLNVVLYGRNDDGSPVLTIRDSWIRGGTINQLKTGGEDGQWWGLSSVRWSSRVRIQDSTLVLAAPTDSHMSEFFASAPPAAKLHASMLWMDQVTLSSRQWPDTLLELIDVDIVADDAWADSEYRDRIVLTAVRQNGNAGQGHKLLMRGGSVDEQYDWGVYQMHGGIARIEVDVGSVHACSYNPQGWTYRVELSGAGLDSEQATCAGAVGEWVLD